MAFQSWLFMINANVGYMNMKCICLHRIKALKKNIENTVSLTLIEALP